MNALKKSKTQLTQIIMSTLAIIMSIVLVIAVLLTVVYVMSLKTREDELHKAEEALQEDRRNLDAEMTKFKSDQETAWLKLSAKEHDLAEQKKEVERITENMYEMDRKVTEKYKFADNTSPFALSMVVLDSEPDSHKAKKYIRKRLASLVGYDVLRRITVEEEPIDGGKRYTAIGIVMPLRGTHGDPVGEPGTPGITGPKGYPGDAGVVIENPKLQ
ncbi:MAG: hypothetical protein IKF90_21470 [Parasporobacterium sp.]|nr:hypothetical protein [Parasporobacterium sp.]